MMTFARFFACEVLFRYAAGEGTRFQHILGNLFRNERLERQFDEWHLGQFARAAIKAAKESRPMSAKKRRFLEDEKK